MVAGASTHEEGTNKILGRLLRGGTPAIAANAINAISPLAAVIYLSVNDYAFWSLNAALLTSMLVIDFGGASLATKLAAERALSRNALLAAVAATVVPAAVLGVLALLIWFPYSSRTSIQFDGHLAILSLSLVVVGAGLRSAGTIFGACCLGRHQFALRALVLLVGAVVGAISMLGLLALDFGTLALGYSAICAGICQIIIGVATCKLDIPHANIEIRRTAIGTFVKTKAAAAILALTVSQVDRWLLATIAAPDVVRFYDVTTRLMTIPKMALIALSAGLISEAQPQFSGTLAKVKELATRAISVLGISAAFAMALMFFVAWSTVGQSIDWRLATVMIILMALAHWAHSVTAIPVMMLTGLGFPQFELRYALPMAIGTPFAFTIGSICSSWEAAVAINSTVMAASSLVFISFTNRMLDRAYVSVEHARRSDE